MKKKLKIFPFLFIFFAINIFIGINLVSAKCTCGGQESPDVTKDKCFAPACSWTDEKTADNGPEVKLTNPIGNITSPQQLIGQIINSVLGIVGSLALLMFIYGGFLWMTAAGSDDKVAKGKETLLWATLGLVVIFSSYALVTFIIKNISNRGG